MFYQMASITTSVWAIPKFVAYALAYGLPLFLIVIELIIWRYRLKQIQFSLKTLLIGVFCVAGCALPQIYLSNKFAAMFTEMNLGIHCILPASPAIALALGLNWFVSGYLIPLAPTRGFLSAEDKKVAELAADRLRLGVAILFCILGNGMSLFWLVFRELTVIT